MRRAQDLMVRDTPTVGPDASVLEVGKLLLRTQLDGVCVVGGDELLGVVTTMDILFKERKVHLPAFLVIMDTTIPLGGRHTGEELRKTLGGKVRDVMSTPAVSVTLEASLQDVATLMVDRHLSVLPVVEGTRLLGVITKQAMLAATLELAEGKPGA